MEIKAKYIRSEGENVGWISFLLRSIKKRNPAIDC